MMMLKYYQFITILYTHENSPLFLAKSPIEQCILLCFIPMFVNDVPMISS